MTTERVLRETTRPVLVTPPLDPGPVRVEDAKRLIGRIVVPVDLSPASLHQTQIAHGLAEALGVPMILVHVIEPLKTRLAARLHVAGFEADRRAVAEDGLHELLATVPRGSIGKRWWPTGIRRRNWPRLFATATPVWC